MSLPPTEELYNALNRYLLEDEAKIIEEQKTKRDIILARFTINEDRVNNILRNVYQSIIEDLCNNEVFIKFDVGSYCAVLYPVIEYTLKKWFLTSNFKLIITNPVASEHYHIHITISDNDKLASADAIKKYKENLEEAAKIDKEIETLKRKREELTK
jgi:hypothetical protein